MVQKDSIVNAVKLYQKGERQVKYTKKAGTHWQMGGILVVKTSGEVGYHYISESLGDFPTEPHFETIIEEEKKQRAEAKKVLY